MVDIYVMIVSFYLSWSHQFMEFIAIWVRVRVRVIAQFCHTLNWSFSFWETGGTELAIVLLGLLVDDRWNLLGLYIMTRDFIGVFWKRSWVYYLRCHLQLAYLEQSVLTWHIQTSSQGCIMFHFCTVITFLVKSWKEVWTCSDALPAAVQSLVGSETWPTLTLITAQTDAPFELD